MGVIDWKMMWKAISIFALVSSSVSKPQFFPNYGHVEMSPRAPPPFLAPLEMSMSLPGGDYGTESDGNARKLHLYLQRMAVPNVPDAVTVGRGHVHPSLPGQSTPIRKRPGAEIRQLPTMRGSGPRLQQMR